jgi:DNA-binding CsgD family transcriptional regulator
MRAREGEAAEGESSDAVVVGLEHARNASLRSRGVSTQRVLRVAIGVQHERVRLRCEVVVPAEVEAAFRDALAAGGGKLAVRVEAVESVEVPASGLAQSERLEMQRRLARLSPAERNVLDLLAEGLTNGQIADRLFLAHKTVKNYVSRLLCKLDMSRRTEAAVFAARMRDSAWSDAYGVVGLEPPAAAIGPA